MLCWTIEFLLSLRFWCGDFLKSCQLFDVFKKSFKMFYSVFFPCFWWDLVAWIIGNRNPLFIIFWHELEFIEYWRNHKRSAEWNCRKKQQELVWVAVSYNISSIIIIKSNVEICQTYVKNFARGVGGFEEQGDSIWCFRN